MGCWMMHILTEHERFTSTQCGQQQLLAGHLIVQSPASMIAETHEVHRVHFQQSWTDHAILCQDDCQGNCMGAKHGAPKG